MPQRWHHTQAGCGLGAAATLYPLRPPSTADPLAQQACKLNLVDKPHASGKVCVAFGPHLSERWQHILLACRHVRAAEFTHFRRQLLHGRPGQHALRVHVELRRHLQHDLPLKVPHRVQPLKVPHRLQSQLQHSRLPARDAHRWRALAGVFS